MTILYALWGLALKSFVYNDTVDHNCVLVSTIGPIKITVYTAQIVLYTLTV